MIWHLQRGTDISMWSGYDWFTQNLHPHLERLVESLRSGEARTVRELAACVTGTPLAQALFDAEDEAHWPLSLPSSLVFPQTVYPLHFVFHRAGERFGLTINTPADLRALHDALSGEWSQHDSATARAIANGLRKKGLLGPVDTRGHEFDRPGIYRLQHAALMFRTPSACLMTDYVLDGGYDNVAPPELLPRPCAIAITHGHGDHFSLPSLLRLPRATPVIVPKMARHSMLGVRMEAMLADAGFENIVALSPGETFKWHDITLSAYPFFGEQPWINFAAAIPDLRNWGLTYVIEANGRQSWVLADSGQEFGNDMAELCPALNEQHGTIHHVFSNLREFRWHPGQIDSSGRYLFCFDRTQLFDAQAWPDGKSMTLGPVGVARLLDAIEAEEFRPYAHWWHQPGCRIEVDGESKEHELVARIGQHSCGHTTRLANWRVGDCLT